MQMVVKHVFSVIYHVKFLNILLIIVKTKCERSKCKWQMSRVMRKPTICICEHKGTDQLCNNCEADQRLCFATRIVNFLFFLNPKFPASSHLLCLYSSVCVRPVRKPYCWFSHVKAQILVHSGAADVDPCIRDRLELY